MTTNYTFPEFDASYWPVKDKAWMAQRKQEWAAIEVMLEYKKTKKARTIIKSYFLKGKLPDWDKLRHWNNDERHLDIFLFLWLHPSRDKDLLIKLRDEYMHSVVIRIGDIGTGYGTFFGEFIIMPSQDYPDEMVKDLKYCITTDGENEFLFDVMMEGLDQPFYELEFLYLDNKPPEVLKLQTPCAKPEYLYLICEWLYIKNFRSINEDYLLQYDKPLEWWYRCFPTDEAYFEKEAQSVAVRQAFREALYRIHIFDTEKEGDTRRTRFAHKLRKLFDERDFIPEFKQMWLDVRAGRLKVDEADWRL